ncbi:MAG: acyl-CoA reductase, partial [Bacteroidetes bacterium]|nr:acyl-CoA reductase [Bacteroidota bacterium]
MESKQYIESFSEWGKLFSSKASGEFQDVVKKTSLQNPWFTEQGIHKALRSIQQNFLDEDHLNKWFSRYTIQPSASRNIGIVMAGNIPLVGFHDLLCVLASGHTATVKLSSKDPYLLPSMINLLSTVDETLADNVSFVEKLQDFDAIIATGSNSSSRYFHYYFDKYPNIIRSNRNSVAVLNGKESDEAIQLLGNDIFQYFGLGCRNVSKLYVPEGYSFDHFLKLMTENTHMMDHGKYKNNYDYNFTVFLMNKIPFLTNDSLMLLENEAIASPLACLYYEYYDKQDTLDKMLSENIDAVQCVVSDAAIELPIQSLGFGKTQEPELWDYP